MGEKKHRLLDKLFQTERSSPPFKKKMATYTVFAFAVGIALMVFGGFQQQPDNQAVSIKVNDTSNKNAKETFGQSKTEGPSTMADYEQKYENDLRDALQDVNGINNVTVMVNLDTTETSVYEKNVTQQSQVTQETDKQGGERSVKDSSEDKQVVIFRNGDQEKPMIVKKIKPTIRGVLVVADGANNIRVKQMIIEAVTRVLDVPSHRVSVLPKKTEGES